MASLKKRMKQLSTILLIMGLFSLTGLFGQNKKTEEKEKIDLNKPVENPDLKKAFGTFNSNKSETNLQLVLSGLKKANFIVLFQADEVKTTKDQNGNTVIDKGSVIKFINCFDKDNKPFLPLFTDWQEVDLWYKQRDASIQSFIMTTFETFEWVSNDKTYNGVVINPGSTGWTMSKEQVTYFLTDFKPKTSR